MLLAGVSAFISGQKKTKKELALFLLKRGLWLIFLELTILNFAWFFFPAESLQPPLQRTSITAEDSAVGKEFCYIYFASSLVLFTN
jgi:hypothetical protein